MHEIAQVSYPGLRTGADPGVSLFLLIARRLRNEQRLDDTFIDDEGTSLTFGSTLIHVILYNAQHRSEAFHLLERPGLPNLPEGNPLKWELATQRR